jgi:hypothetical protein
VDSHKRFDRLGILFLRSGFAFLHPGREIFLRRFAAFNKTASGNSPFSRMNANENGL